MKKSIMNGVFILLSAVVCVNAAAADKQYAYSLDYSAIPADIYKRQITISVSVGTAASCNVTADGAVISNNYNAATGICWFSLTNTASSVVVTAVNWTAGGTGAATKTTFFNNKKWAYSFTFDDGYATDYTVDYPMFSAKNLRAGMSIVTNWIGGGNYMSKTQLTVLFNAGWSVFNHSVSHPQNTISCSNLSTQILPAKTTLETWFPNNYKDIFYVYPYLETGYQTCLSTAGYFRGAEGVDGLNYADNFSSINFFGLYRHGMYASVTSSQANAWADTAATNSRPAWMITFTHMTYSGSSTPGTYDTNESTLLAHINYVYNTYGEGGTTKNMWFAPSDEVLMYLYTRQYLVINQVILQTPTLTPYAGTPTFTVTATPAPHSVMLDDMEDGDTVNNWGGSWYSYSGTGTTITPKPYAMTAGGMTGSANYRAQIEATVTDYAGMGTNLNQAETAVDLTNYTAVQFYVKGSGGTYWFQFTQPSITDGDNFGVTFTAPAAWTLVTVPIDAAQLAQRGYGTASTFTKNAIAALQWASNSNGALDIQIDNVQFLTSVAMSPTNTPAAATSTFTRTNTATSTFTRTATATATTTFTKTNTATYTFTATDTPTGTNTTLPSTATETKTNTQTGTPTATDTFEIPSYTFTITPVQATKTFTVTSTQVIQSATPTATETETYIIPSATFTVTQVQPSATQTQTNTFTVPSATFTVTQVQPSATQTQTNTFTVPSATFTVTQFQASATQTQTNTFTVPSATFTVTMTATYTYIIPGATATRTFTLMPTATYTFTSGPVVTSIKIQLREADTNNSLSSPHPQIRIINTGTQTINMNDAEARYWFNCDCTNQSLQAYVDWAGRNTGESVTSNVTASIAATALGNQSNYISFKFSGSMTLAPGEYIELQARFNKSDWSTMLQSNDWSYNGTTSFADCDKVTGYINGSLVYGSEPSAEKNSLKVADVITYPNPAIQTAGATIKYTVNGSKNSGNKAGITDTSASATLQIFTVSGRLVWQKKLTGAPNISTGEHVVQWDGVAAGHSTLAAGIYTLKVSIATADGTSSGFSRMILLK
jgi:peptidoglycan/xylan/chitin deacetylase (PgdA/CDA1 family)